MRNTKLSTFRNMMIHFKIKIQSQYYNNQLELDTIFIDLNKKSKHGNTFIRRLNYLVECFVHTCFALPIRAHTHNEQMSKLPSIWNTINQLNVRELWKHWMVSYRIGRYVQKSGLIARSNKIENVALDNMPSIFYKIFTVFDNYENSSACSAANILWKLQSMQELVLSNFIDIGK